jgi:hypothetical protein
VLANQPLPNRHMRMYDHDARAVLGASTMNQCSWYALAKPVLALLRGEHEGADTVRMDAKRRWGSRHAVVSV